MRLFVDLFVMTNDSARPFEHVASARPDSSGVVMAIEYEARITGVVLVRLQPELLRDGRYTLTMRATPALGFPVAGHGNRAIHSRFGVAREGGARSHEGIDIFAPRGTPVLAVSDGVVRSTRPNPLGGVVVWLHDAARQQSLYYAHLDRHAVTEGQQVSVGDTIGFVGNTGNAVTTPPHLHFGIYRGRSGAIDPYPWVASTDTSPARVTADTARLGHQVVPQSRGVTLHAGPDSNQPLAGAVTREDTLEVMAAVAAWYRVQRVDGSEGYLRAGVVRDATP